MKFVLGVVNKELDIMLHTTTCPGCHHQSAVDESLIGRFIRCEQCRCMYYVIVPPLGEEHKEWAAIPATGPVSRKTEPTSDRRVENATETLDRRIQQLIAMNTLNLLVSATVLVLVLRQLLK